MHDETISANNETDTSNVTNTEPEQNSDNSNDAATSEPVNGTENDDVNNDKGNKQNGPKFATLEDAMKGYAELHKKFGEQTNELGELRQKAKEYDDMKAKNDAQALKNAQDNGFDSVVEYENNKEIAEYTANEYLKHLSEVAYPAEIEKVIEQYRKNPTKELLDGIEAEFSTETVKRIAIASDRLKDKQKSEFEEQIKQSARDYLNVNVNKYAEDFKSPAFTELYAEAFKLCGCELDTEKFVKLMRNYGDYITKRNGINQSINSENQNETDEIETLTNNSTKQPSGQEKSVLDMTEAELRAYLRKQK